MNRNITAAERYDDLIAEARDAINNLTAEVEALAAIDRPDWAHVGSLNDGVVDRLTEALSTVRELRASAIIATVTEHLSLTRGAWGAANEEDEMTEHACTCDTGIATCARHWVVRRVRERACVEACIGIDDPAAFVAATRRLIAHMAPESRTTLGGPSDAAHVQRLALYVYETLGGR